MPSRAKFDMRKEKAYVRTEKYVHGLLYVWNSAIYGSMEIISYL